MIQQKGLGKSQTKNRLYGLDHLRALAIMLVFIYHYGRLFPHPEWTNTISKFGWTGVDLFFVLSGYLIASQLFAKIAREKKISFREFFLKRFFRIIPAYLVVLTLYFLFPSFREREALAPLWKYLTFTQNLGLDVSNRGTFSHAWSLCIEEQFYFFFPLILIALVYFKAIIKSYWLLILLFLFGFIIRFYAWHSLVAPYASQDDFWLHWSKWIYYPTYSRLDGLLMGVSIAAIFQFKPILKVQIQQYGNLFLLASLLVLTSAYFLCLHEETYYPSIFGFPLVDFGYALMVLSAISPTGFLYKFKSKITGNIALLSYGTYLIHKIIIHITQEQFSKLNIESNSNSMFLICIITSLLAAFILNKIIEKPFLQLRDKILRSKQKQDIIAG
jgi:peptidoglycan/LPS O-acetylase OafA/YrhL